MGKHTTPNPRRGGRRMGAGRPKGSKNKKKTARLVIADFTKEELPAEYLLREMYRFRDMKTEEAAKEARLIAVSVAPHYHAKLQGSFNSRNRGQVGKLAVGAKWQTKQLNYWTHSETRSGG
jgi:hypothetical protein